MIVLDMPLPESCKRCPCYESNKYKCKVTGHMMDSRERIRSTRLRDCPLIEIKPKE